MMVNFSLLGAFAALTVLTTAASSPAIIREYHLKTSVICGDHTKNGLYVSGYHTGAGQGDVALVSNASVASRGFLNGTHQQFNYSTPFPWGMKLAYPAYYTQWLTVEINVGYGDEGFSFNGSGLVSSNPEWVGWLACDWWHGVPQLFWQYFYRDVVLPSSCAKVELLRVDI